MRAEITSHNFGFTYLRQDVQCTFRRVRCGWLYWTAVKGRYGYRNLGAECVGITDDYGDLVVVHQADWSDV